jgi:hypothetical protein
MCVTSEESTWIVRLNGRPTLVDGCGSSANDAIPSEKVLRSNMLIGKYRDRDPVKLKAKTVGEQYERSADVVTKGSAWHIGMTKSKECARDDRFHHQK